jgi:hypothetical protein
MLVLSGVFNTRILDTMNYVNQDYMHVNYTLSCLLYALSNRQPIKKRLFLPGYAPIAIADWSIIVQCHLLVTQAWVLASIGAVVEMGILSTLKRLLMESNILVVAVVKIVNARFPFG